MATEMTAFEAELQAITDAVPDTNPADKLEILYKGRKMITESGVEDHVLKVGEQLPAFTLPDATGKMVSSDELLAQGPLVINFYRGSWCPYCIIELKAYRDRLDEIQALGAQLVAVSPQKPDASLTLQEKENLPFPVLTDVDQKLAEDMRIIFEFPEFLQRLYRDDGGLDLPKENDNTWRLPMPATYVIESNGRVALAHANTTYITRLDPGKVIDVLKELHAKGR